MSEALFPDVVVNGEVVSHALIAAEAQNHHAPRAKPGLAWRKAANALAVRTLLLQESRRRGVDAPPRKVGPQKSEAKDEALIRALLDECIVPERLTRRDVYVEWSRDPSRFRAPCLWEASHILIACGPNGAEDKEAALDRAVAIADVLRAEPARFGEIARAQSDCGSKSAGGTLAQISPGDTAPEFEAALRDLNEGEITDSPVPSRFGWHIIRLDAYLEGAVLPFEAVEQKISEALEKAAWARAAKDYVEQLVASAEISGADL